MPDVYLSMGLKKCFTQVREDLIDLSNYFEKWYNFI